MAFQDQRADRRKVVLVAVVAALLVAATVTLVVGLGGRTGDPPPSQDAATPPDEQADHRWQGDLGGTGRWQDHFGVVHQRNEPVTGATVAPDAPSGDGPALRIRFGEGGSRWGIDARSDFSRLGVPPAEDVTLAYRVRFDEGFEFIGDGKMGGLAGTAPGLEVHEASAGGEFQPGSFSVRAMWQEDRGVVMYLYALHGAGRSIDDPFHGGYGIHHRFVDADGREAGVLQPGVWHDVRHRVKLNTPGQRDGIYELWIDGHRGIRLDDIEYRDVSTPELRADQVVLGFFFGGSPDEYPTRVSDLYTDEWQLKVAAP